MSVATRVIACLDVDAGRVVKGVNFENLRDAGDPVELAMVYDGQGVDELTFLDVTASSGDRQTTYDVVTRTAEQVFIPLTVGGGVRIGRPTSTGCCGPVPTRWASTRRRSRGRSWWRRSRTGSGRRSSCCRPTCGDGAGTTGGRPATSS